MNETYYCIYPSMIGQLIIEAKDARLIRLHLQASTFDPKNKIESQKEPILSQAVQWLDHYFSGSIPKASVPYSLANCSSFQQEVLDLVSQIPYGQNVSYGSIAAKIAQAHGIEKMSAQAIGHAIATNPLPLFIPCHRVINGNGKLGGFSGGLDKKIALLKLEGIL